MIAWLLRAWPLLVTTAMYVLQAIILYVQGGKAMALVFTGYALANIGLLAAI